MYATSIPAFYGDNLPLALRNARERVAYLFARWSDFGTPDLERANVYGQMDALKEILDWIDGVVGMKLPRAQERIQLGTLAAFIKAHRRREHLEAVQHELMSDMRWHNLVTGKLQGYDYALAMLASLGITPLR